MAARLYLPAEWAADAARRRNRARVPEQVGIKIKPELAVEMLAELHAEGRLPPWVTGDEVYGQNPTLLAGARASRSDTCWACHARFRDARLRQAHARTHVSATGWNYRSAGPGSKGERDYAWAWIGTAAPRTAC